MLRYFLLALVVMVLPVLPANAAGPGETAGRVEFVTGDTWFVDASQQKRRPGPGDLLHEADTVVTGSDGEIHLNMEDGGYLAVRPGTQFRVDAYRAHGDKDDQVLFTLVKGALRSFTGWIHTVAPRRYQIRTLTAAVGVRGTDHETLFIPAGSNIGEPGTYDKVNEGATFITHASGQVDVLPGSAGFAPLAPTGIARLLERIPDFFRPTAYEYLLTGRHQLVQDKLQEKLEARRRLKEQQQPRQGQPKGEPTSEMQEAPTNPDGADLRDAPGSSLAPALPAAALPGASAVAPSLSAPAVPAATAPVTAPAARAVAPASATGSAPSAAPPVAAPAAKEQVQPASRARDVKEAEKPATDQVAPRAVTESERERLYKERRRKQLEGRQELYEEMKKGSDKERR